MVRPAHPKEAALISALAIRSKAHWGYSPREMQVFEEELTLHPEEVESKNTHVLEVDGSIVGFYTLVEASPGVAELEHLFVGPHRLHCGHGSELFRHARQLATERGYGRLIIQCDPNAEGFYVKHGVPLIRRIPSSIPARSIPYFELHLELS